MRDLDANLRNLISVFIVCLNFQQTGHGPQISLVSKQKSMKKSAMLVKCLALLLMLSTVLPTTSQEGQTAVTLYTKEEIPIGNEIGNLKSRFSYPDGSTFAMLFPDQEINGLFKLDSRSGVLSTIARLDREVLCPSKPPECVRTFNAEVKRGGTGQEEVIIVRLVINDVNDQRPKFEAKHRKFRISIPESDNPPSYYSLPTAEDSDSDVFDNVVYKLEAIGDSGMYFKLSMEERGGKRVPKLELIRALDRETQDKYELQLLVSDEQYPQEVDRANIEIEVLDANDNKPQWRLAKQLITISECDRLHRTLLKLNATDEDLNERITYSIGKAAGKDVAKSFYISGDELKQNQSLDYEQIRKKVLYIPLVAEDRGGSAVETYVELRVTDCNDHYPNITVEVIEDKITENDDSEKVLARILVVDEDEGNNGTVDCVIGDPNRQKFQLDNRITDGQYKTIYKLKKLAHISFDREATPGGEIRIDIICTDKGTNPRVGRKEVKVKILDENDSTPKTDKNLYEFRIRENSPPNTLVGRVMATDDDIEENARLRFSLDSDGSRNFLIRNQGRNMAEIYSAVIFDREQLDHYQLIFTVADSGLKEQRTATATVKVIIEDENDSVPAFQFREYMFKIEEDYGKNVSQRCIGEVEATDDDIGANQMIWYEVNRQYQAHLATSGISGMYFYFNRSHLYGEGNFDREKQEIINLEIFARNRGPTEHRASARVTIVLNDVNDNAPSIRGLQKVYNLSDSSPAGTPVLQVSGTDEDAAENSTLTYLLEETEDNRFTIDGKHGIVTLSGSLKDSRSGDDSSRLQTYRLNIRVRDNGNPPLQSARYTTFVHVSSSQMEQIRRVNQPPNSGNGGGKVQRGVETSDQNLLILLCLAAVVFVVFVALLVILLYVHARGRREVRNRTRHPGVWYDKANGETVEEQPSEALTETGIGIYRFADNPGTCAPLQLPATAITANSGSIVRNKYPSFGYLASIDKQRGYPCQSQGVIDDQQPKSYYETYGRGSDRLPRKSTAFQQTAAAAAAAGAGAGSSSQTGRTMDNHHGKDSKEYSNLVGRVEENRYADHHQQRYQQQQQQHQQHPGYAMLAETPASAVNANSSNAVKPTDNVVCRTPYMTSSFV